MDSWRGPYLNKSELPKDPWGRPYVYRSPGQHGDYDLLSYGPDGVEGGEGENSDITSWK
jgi:general secretion pathway protein G